MKSGSLSWRPNLQSQAADLQRSLEQNPLEDFSLALDREAEKRLAEFASGVRRYHDFDRPTRKPEASLAWQAGSTRLLHYPAKLKRGKAVPPVLVVPSLINRAYILDLTEKRSLMRYLAAQGMDAYLVDWGAPNPEELEMNLSGYIAGRLEDIAAFIVDKHACGLGLVGYCMGGLLALALAQRQPRRVSCLALLATPWDFHQPSAAQGQLLKAIEPQLRPLIDHHRGLPVDALQAMFASVSPFQTTEKFRAFGKLGSDPRARAKADLFVAVEDWLNDGVPLSRPVALECLFDWYGDNTPARGLWRVADRPVRPDEITQACLTIIPTKDQIVPPESAQALAPTLSRFERWDIAAGHIGMVTGSKAEITLYQPLAKWLKSHI